MPIRRRKIRSNITEDSLSDTQIDYTLDEEEDFRNPFVTRPRLDRSPISNRTRSRVNLNSLVSIDINRSCVNRDNEMASNQDNSTPGAAGTSSGNVNVNLSSLEAMLERVLTLNQNSFMKEIQNLRRTLVETVNRNHEENQNENISRISHGSPVGHSNSGQENYGQSDSPRGTLNLSLLRIDKWNIFFDGTGDIHNFLFKIETLRTRYNYTEDQVVASFHLFLKGKAEIWFWFYLKQKPNTTYEQLSEAIIKEFETVENDCDKIVRMVERRQMPKESFDDFFTELVSMNSRLSTPMTNQKMIELLKNNVKDSLGSLLFSCDIFSLDHLREAARKAEKYIARQNHLRYQKRFVAEVDNFRDSVPEAELEEEVDAISYNRVTDKKTLDTSRLKCWNCDQQGHSFYDCPSDKRNLFCFRCGEKGVTTPQCRKHLGNRQLNEK